MKRSKLINELQAADPIGDQSALDITMKLGGQYADTNPLGKMMKSAFGTQTSRAKGALDKLADSAIGRVERMSELGEDSDDDTNAIRGTIEDIFKKEKKLPTINQVKIKMQLDLGADPCSLSIRDELKFFNKAKKAANEAIGRPGDRSVTPTIQELGGPSTEYDRQGSFHRAN